MRAMLIALGLLATAPAALASGQDQLPDARAAIDQVFWPRLYANGGNTFYCDRPFHNGDSGLVATALYSERQIKSALRCITENQCRVVNPKFDYMLADLHNRYPEQAEVDAARRNSVFAQAEPGSADARLAGNACALKLTFRSIEPRDAVKGNVARALFYMHDAYGLPLPAELSLLQRWHQMDPADDDERARNGLIEKLQGNRNPYIDDPGLASRLVQD